jgi:hypothetical protein
MKRALFALFSAFVVAIAEAGLYLILSSRQSKQPSGSAALPEARYKKIEPETDPNIDTEVVTDSKEETKALRRRK